MPKNETIAVWKVETAKLSDLYEHPRNYRVHPEDQIDHLCESIRQHGFYRNVVVSRAGAILAGNGAVQAAAKLDMTEIPVTRLDLDDDDPHAIKILVSDNTLANLAEDDDRERSELLKQLHEGDELFGTGYDEAMLANFVMVTRPMSEIQDHDAAAEWVGLPEYEPKEADVKLTLFFESEDDRDLFCVEHGGFVNRRLNVWSSWWPAREGRDDPGSVKFEG